MSAQQTPDVKRLLKYCKTSLANVPGGRTHYVQVLDVSVNKPFKEDVRRQSEEHMENDLHLYVNGKLYASDPRILITKVYFKSRGTDCKIGDHFYTLR